MSKAKELRAFAEKNAWLILALAAGLLLMGLGGGGSGGKETSSTAYEQRLTGALSRMEGVGEVYVLLAEKPGREQGFSGAVVVCAGGSDPGVQLRVTRAVQAFTDLGSDKIIIQKMIS